jgi:tetratricopeptide (TPR) repeat protein
MRFPQTVRRCISRSDSEVKTRFLTKVYLSGSCILGCVALFTSRAFAQAPAVSSPAAPSSTLERGIDLAGTGRCEEALPLLKKFTAQVTVKELKYRALMSTVRCAMKQRDERTTVVTLFDMKREFPEDPEVLYMTSEFFLEIAEQASQELTVVAPDSYQTRELQAETLESQNKWEEAVVIYKKILQENPKLRGIHFRLGRGMLSQTDSPTSIEDAKKEFDQELAIDPVNAAAEFWLGEIARRESKWEDAISHFSSAARLDSSYAEAFLGLGMALKSAGRFSEAIPQLEQYVRMSPEDPAGHYQLSIAYARTGRKEDFAREVTIHQQLLEKKQAAANARATATPH